MADTKISGLTAAGAAALTHEYPVNEGGANKKVTGTQLSTLLANPASDGGDDLGTAALRWLNLFLGNGGKIDFNAGEVTLTHGSKKVTLAGGGLVLPANDSAQAPLVMNQGGSLMTTPAAGAVEMDANCLYACTDAGNRGVIPVQHFIRCDSARTLPNNTNLNPIFNSPTNGTLTLETGCYLFESMGIITAMSATSGNCLFNLLGAGGATLAAQLWRTAGIDNTTPSTLLDDDVAFLTGNTTAAAFVTAVNNTAVRWWFKGTFEVSVAGTVIPSVQLANAAAAIVSIGSYFMCYRIGSTSVASVGQWT